MKNSSYMIGIAVMMLAAAFTGVCFTDDVYAEGDPGAGEVVETLPTEIAYKVDGKTYSIPVDGKTFVTLPTLGELGAKLTPGKEFKGWMSGGNSYAAGSTFILKATAGGVAPVVEADIQDIMYTVTFDDGIGNETVTENVTYNAELVDIPADPVKTGFIFLGWVAEGAPEGTEPITAGFPNVTADVTYNAIYMKDWTVTFVDGDKTFVTKASTPIAPDLGDRTGFTFLGWYIGTEQIPFTEVGENTGVFKTDYKFIADTTLTAKWEPINCYVTFIAGDFEKTVPVLFGQTVGQLALPEGYVEWDFDFTTPITDDVTISAVEAEAPEPGFFSTPTGKCVIILVMFVIGFLVYMIYSGKLAEYLPKKTGGKKE